jgi:predicted deacylase
MNRPKLADTSSYVNTKRFLWLEVTTRLDGTVLRIPLHVITGAQDGPTLALTSGLHGSEWLGIEVFRRLMGTLDPNRMRGRVLAVPVGNPQAFQHLTRNTPDESDEPDLNRVFPGGDTWLTVQIAREIDQEVLAHADYLIDFHAGIWGSAMGEVGYGQDVPNQAVASEAAAIAHAFGYPCVRRLNVMGGFPGPRSIGAYSSARLEIPAISASIGGCGFSPELEERWIEMNVNGIRNVMMHVGILEGVPDRPPRYLSFEGRGHRVVPSVGGYLDPVVSVDSLMREVHEGELLARVISPYSFEELELLRSPVHGVLFGVARAYPVMPGDWAYFVADLDAEGTYWLEGG